MKLFFVLVCCLAIPLVARAADQGNNNKGNKKPTTQGQQRDHGFATKQPVAREKPRPASRVERSE
jgi:hypothetical protein